MSVNTLRPSLALCQDSLRRIFSHKRQSAVNQPQRFEVSHKDSAGEVCPTVKIKQSLTAGGWTEKSDKTLKGREVSSERLYAFGSQ